MLVVFWKIYYEVLHSIYAQLVLVLNENVKVFTEGNESEGSPSIFKFTKLMEQN